MNNPDIVIPTKNEQNYIENILYDLNNQILIDASTPMNVYIADADSDDLTIRVINTIKWRLHNLNINIIPGGSVSVGRNNGFRHTKSDIVIFIDADVRLFESNVILNTVNSLNRYRLVTCKLKDYSGSLMAKFAFSVYNILHKILVLKYPFAIGAYFAVHSSDFNKFGMFNEHSDNSEDFLFSQNYAPSQFKVLNNYIGQDDRRFKKMGYFGMGMHLLRNFSYYLINNTTQFTKKSGYWN